VALKPGGNLAALELPVSNKDEVLFTFSADFLLKLQAAWKIKL